MRLRVIPTSFLIMGTVALVPASVGAATKSVKPGNYSCAPTPANIKVLAGNKYVETVNGTDEVGKIVFTSGNKIKLVGGGLDTLKGTYSGKKFVLNWSGYKVTCSK
jgi:hypothetical protein